MRPHAVVWWLVAALGAGSALVLVIDLAEQSHMARAQATEYVTILFGGETGRALMTHPLSVTAWRLNRPGARVVNPDAVQVTELVNVLLDPESYAPGGPSGPVVPDEQGVRGRQGVPIPQVPWDSTVRFEDEHGSLNVMIAADGSAVDILRDGSRISQASTIPAQERLHALLNRILGERTSGTGR